MVLNSGKYRNYVTIKKATVTSDQQGGRVASYAADRYEWMQVSLMAVNKSLDAGGINYRRAGEFRARYNDDDPIGYDDIISYNGEDYKIYSILPDEMQRYVIIIAYV